MSCFSVWSDPICLAASIRCCAVLMIHLGVLVLSCWGQISSGSVLGSCPLFRALICITRSTITYAVVHFALGWIGGYLVGSDIFGLFGRLFRALGWFNGSYVFYDTICGASL